MAAASPPPVALALATPADIPDAADLYTAVFSSNPAYSSIFRGLPAGRQTAALRWLFERRMRVLLAAGNPFVVGRDPGSGRLVAAVGAVLPGRKPGTLRLLWHGLAAWPLVWGWNSMRRALSLEQLLQGGCGGGDGCGSGDGSGGGGGGGGNSSGRGEAAWEECRLAMMAVCSDWQRRGVASALLAVLLEEVASQAAPRPRRIALDTQHTGAVELYKRHGFSVMARGEVEPPGGGARFTSWVMARDLEPAAAATQDG